MLLRVPSVWVALEVTWAGNCESISEQIKEETFFLGGYEYILPNIQLNAVDKTVFIFSLESNVLNSFSSMRKHHP